MGTKRKPPAPKPAVKAAPKRKPRLPTTHDRARKALALMTASVVALRAHLAANRIITQRPFAVKNVDATVDAEIATILGEPFTNRETHTILDRIEEKGPTLDKHYLHVIWGVFDEWLFQDKPKHNEEDSKEDAGFLFFSYRFRFFHPGELDDKERKRLKKRRYVPRVTLGREGYIIPVPTGWMPAGPNAIPPGRWHDGHEACHHLIDDYMDRHKTAVVSGVEFRLRWTPNGDTPSRAL